MSGSGGEDGRSLRASHPSVGRREAGMLEVGSTRNSLGGLVAQLEAQTGSGQVEPREKPTSAPKSGFTSGTLDPGSQTAIQTCEVGLC